MSYIGDFKGDSCVQWVFMLENLVVIEVITVLSNGKLYNMSLMFPSFMIFY